MVSDEKLTLSLSHAPYFSTAAFKIIKYDVSRDGDPFEFILEFIELLQCVNWCFSSNLRSCRSLVFQVFSLVLPSAFFLTLWCVFWVLVVPSGLWGSVPFAFFSSSVVLLLTYLQVYWFFLLLLKSASETHSEFSISVIVLFDSGNPIWLSSCLFVDSPYLVIRCPHACSSPPRRLFIWLHQVLVEAHGIFSLHCSRWSLQLWRVGVFSCDRWGLQLWCVGSSAVACGIFSCVGSSVVACDIQFPDQGLNPVSLALGAQSLSRWITREVPLLVFLLGFLQFFEYI